jgi:hypothetical protein
VSLNFPKVATKSFFVLCPQLKQKKRNCSNSNNSNRKRNSSNSNNSYRKRNSSNSNNFQPDPISTRSSDGQTRCHPNLLMETQEHIHHELYNRFSLSRQIRFHPNLMTDRPDVTRFLMGTQETTYPLPSSRTSSQVFTSKTNPISTE